MKATGRKVGVVVALGPPAYCAVPMEKWFTESEVFATRGRWVQVAEKGLDVGQSVYKVLADGNVMEGVVVRKEVSGG